MPISLRRTTALLAAGGALAAASIVAASPADAAASHHRGIFYLHSTAKKLVKSRSTIAPGVVQFHNAGNRPVVVLSKKHAGLDKLVKELKGSGQKLFTDFAMRGVVMPHHSLYLRLHRGTLYTLDGERDKYPASSVHVVTVAGKTLNAKLPYSRAITLSAHQPLRVPANTSHHTWFHVINNSYRTKDVLLFRIGKHTSLADLKKAVAHPTDANLAKIDFDFRHVVGLAELGAHQTSWVRYQGGKGNGLVVGIAITGKASNFFAKGGLGAIHFH